MSKKTAGSDAVNKPVRSDSAKKSVGSGNVRKKAPGKKTQKKELKISRRTIIAGAAVLGAVLCVVILFAVVSFRRAQAVSIPATYSNRDMVYNSKEEIALDTTRAFAYGLCVSSEDVGNEAIVLREGESAALMSLDNREVLFSKNMHERIYPASITKIMTAILTLKYGNMDEVVTVIWRDLELEAGSQVVGFRIGDRVTVRELLHGLLVHSGNDAAMVLARHIGGGSVEHFVDLMNQRFPTLISGASCSSENTSSTTRIRMKIQRRSTLIPRTSISPVKPDLRKMSSCWEERQGQRTLQATVWPFFRRTRSASRSSPLSWERRIQVISTRI